MKWYWWMVLVILLLGCGGVPYQECNAVEEKRCSEDGLVIETCDGANWQPTMDCEEIWEADGAVSPHECVVDAGVPKCQKVSE